MLHSFMFYTICVWFLFVCRGLLLDRFLINTQMSEHPVNAQKTVWVHFSADIAMTGPKRAKNEAITAAELDRQHTSSPDEDCDIVWKVLRTVSNSV